MWQSTIESLSLVCPFGSISSEWRNCCVAFHVDLHNFIASPKCNTHIPKIKPREHKYFHFVCIQVRSLSQAARSSNSKKISEQHTEWKKEWAFLCICMDHCECEPKSEWYKSVLWLETREKEKENNNTHAHIQYMHKWPEEKVGKLCGYVFLVCKQRANDTHEKNLPIYVLYGSLVLLFCCCYYCFSLHSNDTLFLRKTLAQFNIFKLKKPNRVRTIASASDAKCMRPNATTQWYNRI